MGNAQSIKATVFTTLTIKGNSQLKLVTLRMDGNVFEADQETLYEVVGTWELRRNDQLVGEFATEKELVALLRGGMACRHEDAPMVARKIWNAKINVVMFAAKAA